MNLLGVWLGHKTLRWLELREFNFSGVAQLRQPPGTVVRVLGQFTPKTWTRYHWGMFTHWKRFLYVLVVVFFFQLLDLNSFFLKALLWLRPSHFLNAARLLVLVPLAALSLRQAYQYIIDRRTKDIGGATWLLGAILLLEGALSARWAYPLFRDVPWPPAVLWGWAGVGAALLVGGTAFFGFREAHTRLVEQRKHKE